MRLSAIQRDILKMLFQIHQQIGDRSFPCMKLLEIMNKSRFKEIFPNNFRLSCHTMARHGLIEVSRDEPRITLSMRITAEGLKKAAEIHQQDESKD